ncbi:hypothetical protein CCHR01_17041 [Colletotrichum chrysophilum]|uniref:Uncharacterized protein n=1 Tax=Colletotrichum chrysophilum TaxID=1836956 RepID=A0AAD9A3E2_9PEZI|nr:hypothetical protein CCHR01_17041 [Colletotrichum chrysophilum]
MRRKGRWRSTMMQTGVRYETRPLDTARLGVLVQMTANDEVPTVVSKLAAAQINLASTTSCLIRLLQTQVIPRVLSCQVSHFFTGFAARPSTSSQDDSVIDLALEKSASRRVAHDPFPANWIVAGSPQGMQGLPGSGLGRLGSCEDSANHSVASRCACLV